MTPLGQPVLHIDSLRVMSTIPERHSARLLIIDTAGRLLLFRYDDPRMPPFWATVGGQLLPGESYQEAAARELAEETGYADPIGKLVRVRDDVFAAGDVPTARWLEHYFEVRTIGGELNTTRWTDEERRTISDARWWTLDELRETNDVVFPPWIADELAALLAATADTDAAV